MQDTTNATAAPHAIAVVLTAAPDCAPINPLLAACTAELGGDGSATCVSAPSCGLQALDRDDVRSLRFSFPDTDALIPAIACWSCCRLRLGHFCRSRGLNAKR